MSMRSTAAVLFEVNRPFEIKELELASPSVGEVLVRIVAAGVCHSDHHLVSGYRPVRLPVVLGHEGAGIVEEVGPGVVGLHAGDKVLQMFVAPCGICRTCSRGSFTFCEGNTPVADGAFADGTHRFSLNGESIASAARLASYSTLTVCPANSLVKVPESTDMVSASMVACAVATGVGSAINIAGIKPGDSVAVMGIGGVGMAAIQGAVIAGAGAVIAIDLVQAKLDIAIALGATSTVKVGDGDVVLAVRAMTGGYGVDHVLITASKVDNTVIETACELIDTLGHVVIVGLPVPGLTTIPVAPATLLRKQATVTGTLYGSTNPRHEILRCLELVAAGRLDLASMVTRTYQLEEINIAFSDMLAGKNVRGIIVNGEVK